ncbi:MAG: amidohydrolase family protein [Desulfovibrio sp.]|jgi:predicted TIM-barrel fold metal-dependent hydrolase|nr:amidohydrolase family protein [Desulfovibrio sp.]
MHFDIHTHAFHPKIAAKAVASLNRVYGITCTGDGIVDSLLAREKQAGIDRCVVLCAATAPAQVIPANNYAIELLRKHPEVLPFGSIHPACDDWEEELERLARAGICGIKLHPDFQGFWLNDPRLDPIFEHCRGRFVFEIHIGADTPPEQNPSCPYKLASILKKFPDITVIVGHLGGYLMWEHALRLFASGAYQNLWFDTSSVSPFASPELLRLLLTSYDRDRLLFGTDWPLFDPVDEVERLTRLGRLSEIEVDRLMGNAAFLFHRLSSP